MEKNRLKDKGLAFLFLLLGMSLFGSATPISKLVGQSFPIFTASFLRVLLGALILLPFVIKDLKQLASIQRKDWYLLSAIALFGMVGFTIFLILGMKFISGVAGSIIMSFTPGLTALGAFIFLRSSLGRKKIIAILLGIVGIIVINIYKKQFGATNTLYFYLGVMLVFFAVVCEGAYTLLGKKVTQQLDPLLTSFLACTISLPLFFILALFDIGNIHFAAIQSFSWYYLLWWGIGTLGMGSAFWYSGVAKTEGSTAAGFMAVMPVSALLLSYFLLGEKFYWIHLLGIGLVMISVILISFEDIYSTSSK